MTGKRNQSSPVGSPASEISSKDQDRFLPIANVSRIMKRALPANAKISKEAKEAVQECVSEFISFITGEASDKCQKEKRKTINGDDLLWAMTTLGFDNYVGSLKAYINNYRETEGDRSGCISSAEAANNGVAEINKSASSVSSKAGFNGGFYSVGNQVGPTSLTNYRENSMNRAIAQNVVYEDADTDGNRTMAASLRYRVEW